jgi:TetR/AcrR family transcriptional repressor of nem operon
MSYKHISEAVGIRKASVHHHLPKKENLVDELLERCAISSLVG